MDGIAFQRRDAKCASIFLFPAVCLFWRFRRPRLEFGPPILCAFRYTGKHLLQVWKCASVMDFLVAFRSWFAISAWFHDCI